MPNRPHRFTVRRLTAVHQGVMQAPSDGVLPGRQGQRSAQDQQTATRLAELLPDGCILGLFRKAECVGFAAVDVARGELLGPFILAAGSSGSTGSERIGNGGELVPDRALERLIVACERLAARYQLFDLHSTPPLNAVACLEASGYRRSGDEPHSEQPGFLRRFPRRQTRYGRRAHQACEELGVPKCYSRLHRLPLQPEARVLVSAGNDIYDRAQRLSPGAASAWRALRNSASADGVVLQMVSAYRSLDYQAGLLRRKIEQGQELARILEVSAAPGFSEHHTGRALDLTTPGSPVLEEAFEETPAFDWLRAHAPDHGFRMSFPRNNRHGVLYEPWHWFYVG